jgi:uncharacterized protein YbbK (DUF523 family)
MRICSACLLGIKCRYDAKSKPNEKVIALSKKETLIPLCAEQLGGLHTPRIAQEIQGMSGEKVLDGTCKVLNKEGTDVTKEFVAGAKEVLKIAKLYNIKNAILKQKSPSCGCGKTFDGTFTQTFIDGDGVTTALLKRNGINVISEEEL